MEFDTRWPLTPPPTSGSPSWVQAITVSVYGWLFRQTHLLEDLIWAGR